MDTPTWNKAKPQLTIIKVGGAIVEDESQLQQLLDVLINKYNKQ